MSEDKTENSQAAKPEKEDVYKRLNAFRPPDNNLKKHPCKDCFNCLFCGDARCDICLNSRNCCQQSAIVLKNDSK